MVSITVQLNFDYALSFRFFLLWQPLVETGARSQSTFHCYKSSHLYFLVLEMDFIHRDAALGWEDRPQGHLLEAFCSIV